MDTMQKDIVCGMEVTTDTPFHTEFEGETYYFCSEHCLEKFNIEPKLFTVKKEQEDCCGLHHHDNT
ncbi:MAG: hypothetical protein DSZ03_07115, partial [Sulfurimonas sp.]